VRPTVGAVAEGEWFALGYFDNARFGLEAYAEAIGKIYDVQLLPQTSGLCTWYMDCQARRLRLETKDVSPPPCSCSGSPSSANKNLTPEASPEFPRLALPC